MTQLNKKNTHHTTAEKDRVPFVQKLAIGLGEIPGVGSGGIQTLAFPVFNLFLGISPVLIATVMAVVRIWDAITDPLAGSISDRTITRFGRRKPYLFVSSLICGLSLPMVYLVSPSWSSNLIFAYFFFWTMVFYTSYSFFNIPLVAIAMEATADYHERTRVMAYKFFISAIGGIFGSWLFYITQLDRFENTLQGARFTSLILGIIMIVFGLIPAILVKEGYLEVAKKEKQLRFFQSLRETLKNKPFLIICMVAIAKDIPLNMINTVGLYVTIFYVFKGDMLLAGLVGGLAGTMVMITTMAVMPSISSMITKSNKTRAVKVCLSILVVASALKWIAYSPDRPWMIVVISILLAVPLSGLNISIKAMIADICDWDEIYTNSRREGMYASVYAWVAKATSSISLMLSGVVLVYTGFDQSLGVNQSDNAILFMRLAFVLSPIIGIALALIAIQFYPLTEQKAYEIREELEARRGSIT